jgi:hypothetical protein
MPTLSKRDVANRSRRSHAVNVEVEIKGKPISSPTDGLWHGIEQPAGPPLVSKTVDPRAVDEHRKATYQSYEKFLRDRLVELDQARPSQWHRDYSSIPAYEKSVEPMRARLKQMLGFWVEPDQRGTVVRTDEEVLLEEKDFIARRFRFEILPGLSNYAVELIPFQSREPRPGLLAQHGYGGTPELVCGLTRTANDEDYAYRSLGIRAVRRGFHVIAVHHPSGYGSDQDVVMGLPQFPTHPPQYGKNRLHRLAVMASAKTLFGLDMMGSSRGIDLLVQSPDVDRGRIGMYGLSQGGQSSIYLTALDLRVQASVASAWFNWRFPSLVGGTRETCYLDSLEEDKFFPDMIPLFSDSDVVSLICPRPFAVEAGLHDTSVDFALARGEFERARLHYNKLSLCNRIEFIAHRQGHVSATARAMEFLHEHLT